MVPFYFYIAIIGGSLLVILLFTVLVWNVREPKKRKSKNFMLWRNGKKTKFFWDGSKHYRLDVGSYDEDEFKNRE